MPGGHESSGPYGPGSLDYISLPNPVEPHTVPHKHPLNVSLRPDRSSNQDLRRLLNSPDTPHKRRKCGGGEVQEVGGETSHAPARSLPKPKLPPGSSKRMRIPPTLSGLHQPPPEARVLPSINVEQPKTADSTSILNEVNADDPVGESSQSAPPAKVQVETQSKKSKPGRNRWTTEETRSLLDGVSRFGIGKWTQILKCSDYSFERRTAIDLKDRFRVCRPDDYEQGRSRRKDSSKPDDAAQCPLNQPTSEKRKHGARTHRIEDSELGQLGVNAAFAKSERRQRRAYTSEEDAAILEGFLKHGNKWLDIQQDDTLVLVNRTSTDIRDRMRTKYPEQYAKVCASRPQSFPKRAKRVPEATDGPVEAKADATAAPGSPKAIQKPIVQSRTKSSLPAVHKQPALFRLDDHNDVFFGAPFEDESDTEPLVLDRGILDWAISDANKVSNADASKHGIDPAVILKRPAYTSMQNHQQMLPPFDGGMAPLPSLADITSGSGHADEGQLELPSLMQYFGSIDTDARSGQIPTIEELLS